MARYLELEFIKWWKDGDHKMVKAYEAMEFDH